METALFHSDIQGFVFKALLWGLTYYFIRRLIKPEEDLEKFKTDAIYGIIASFVSAILYWYVEKYVIPRL